MTMRLSQAIRDLSLKRVLAAAIWCGVMSAVVLLWGEVGRHGTSPGFGEREEYRVAAERTGRIATLEVSLGQRVKAGQLIAALETTDLDARLRMARHTEERLRAELQAVLVKSQTAALTNTHQLQRTEETYQAELALAQGRARVKSAELEALAAQIAELRDLMARKMVVKQELNTYLVRQSTLASEEREAREAIVLARSQLAAAQGRRQALPEYSAATTTAPLSAHLAESASARQRLEALRQATLLRAPADGLVSTIHLRAGEVARPGEPVVSLVAEHVNRVVVCVAEVEAGLVQLGARATVYARDGRAPLHGRVVSLGPMVSEVPVRCQRIAQQPAWGREAILQLDQASDLLPGMAFDISFEEREDESGVAYASPQENHVARPQLMRIPAALSAVSRLEPSGLVWVPRLDRYVLISDDTGFKGRQARAPLLFTMNQQGEVDPLPMVVQGIAAFDDLEAIAADSSGALYLLASQSINKKGRRSAARELFARLVPDGAGYRVEAQVQLAALLGAATLSTLQQLGLREVQSLDIEGLTVGDGGLLIGLKAPLAADGRAIIWQMKTPERLFATGQLSAAGLQKWATVALTVQADGRSVPGGIADLLWLSESTLLLGVTASGIEPRQQAGSIWSLSLAGRIPAPLATLVRTFADRKPEGLARSPHPGQVTVVFDLGQRTPEWMEIPCSR
jgi:HlyD family secretion protein